MNREEAIAIIRKEYLCVDRDCDIDRSCGKCDLMMPSKEPILEAYKMAIKALEQMPVTTTAGEGGVIYYPQVEGVTPTVVDAGKKEPCEDAISREPFIDSTICEGFSCNECSFNRKDKGGCILEERVKALPSIQPKPKTGHWIPVTNGRGGNECSLCHVYAPSYQNGDEWLTKYCPNCGARMVEPQESEDEEQIKVGTKVRTIKDKDFAGEEVFPVETIGVVEEIREDEKLPYKIRANLEYWYYSRDMFEVIEDIEPQERSGEE